MIKLLLILCIVPNFISNIFVSGIRRGAPFSVGPDIGGNKYQYSTGGEGCPYCSFGGTGPESISPASLSVDDTYSPSIPNIGGNTNNFINTQKKINDENKTKEKIRLREFGPRKQYRQLQNSRRLSVGYRRRPS